MMTTTKTDDLAVANTILAQIRKADFWAMARWGVSAKLAGPDSLRLVLAPSVKIVITLTPADTYTVALYKTPRKTRAAMLAGNIFPAKIAEMEGVYFDSLVTVIDGMVSK